MRNDYLFKSMDIRLNNIKSGLYLRDNNSNSDEKVLEKMNIKVIENFLRKKKLNNINK